MHNIEKKLYNIDYNNKKKSIYDDFENGISIANETTLELYDCCSVCKSTKFLKGFKMKYFTVQTQNESHDGYYYIQGYILPCKCTVGASLSTICNI